MDKTLLALLACPQCKGPLTLCGTGEGLHCAACHLVYPIIEGIPVLLPGEGRPEAQQQPE